MYDICHAVQSKPNCVEERFSENVLENYSVTRNGAYFVLLLLSNLQHTTTMRTFLEPLFFLEHFPRLFGQLFVGILTEIDNFLARLTASHHLLQDYCNGRDEIILLRFKVIFSWQYSPRPVGRLAATRPAV